MHRPAAFREDRPEVMHDLIRAYPLGVVVSVSADRLDAAHLPFVVEAKGEFGRLLAHMPRADAQVEVLRGASEVLVIFRGPDAYVSPSWYPSKAVDGRAVPTWNHVTVQAWGRPRIIEDAAWIRRQIEQLTNLQEAGRPEPWSVSDAPEAYVAGMLNALVGLEIEITRMEGKWKVSQNRPEADRLGVVEGLMADGREAMARAVAGRS